MQGVCVCLKSVAKAIKIWSQKKPKTLRRILVACSSENLWTVEKNWGGIKCEWLSDELLAVHRTPDNEGCFSLWGKELNQRVQFSFLQTSTHHDNTSSCTFALHLNKTRIFSCELLPGSSGFTCTVLWASLWKRTFITVLLKCPGPVSHLPSALLRSAISQTKHSYGAFKDLHPA